MCYTKWQSVIIIILIPVTCMLFPAYAETFVECNSPNNFNLYIASRSNCARYIYCDGEDSFMGECLDDNYFNEVAGNCDDRESVVCRVGMNNTENEGQMETTSQDLTQSTSTDVTATSSILTTTTTVGPTTTSATNSFQPTQPTSIIVRPTSPPIEQTGNGTPQCPRSADPTNTIYLPNARQCSAYYICHFGIAIPMSCPGQFYFNSLSGRCERRELVQCAQVNRPARVNCVRGVYDFIPHPDNCEYYYFCANGFLMIFQCPAQFSWHYERKTCVHKSQMKCFTNYGLW